MIAMPSCSSIRHCIRRAAARSAVAGLHDGICVRHHAGGGEPGLRRGARALSAHPLRAGACRRADAVFRLAAVGVADDRQAARADVAGRRSTSGCGASGTTTRWRRPPKPSDAWRAWRRRTRSCSAATGRSRIPRVIDEAVRTYEGVAMPPTSGPRSTGAMPCRFSRSSHDGMIPPNSAEGQRRSQGGVR